MRHGLYDHLTALAVIDPSARFLLRVKPEAVKPDRWAQGHRTEYDRASPGRRHDEIIIKTGLCWPLLGLHCGRLRRTHTHSFSSQWLWR